MSRGGRPQNVHGTANKGVSMLKTQSITCHWSGVKGVSSPQTPSLTGHSCQSWRLTRGACTPDTKPLFGPCTTPQCNVLGGPHNNHLTGQCYHAVECCTMTKSTPHGGRYMREGSWWIVTMTTKHEPPSWQMLVCSRLPHTDVQGAWGSIPNGYRDISSTVCGSRWLSNQFVNDIGPWNPHPKMC